MRTDLEFNFFTSPYLKFVILPNKPKFKHISHSLRTVFSLCNQFPRFPRLDDLKLTIHWVYKNISLYRDMEVIVLFFSRAKRIETFFLFRWERIENVEEDNVDLFVQ